MFHQHYLPYSSCERQSNSAQIRSCTLPPSTKVEAFPHMPEDPPGLTKEGRIAGEVGCGQGSRTGAEEDGMKPQWGGRGWNREAMGRGKETSLTAPHLGHILELLHWERGRNHRIGLTGSCIYLFN